MLPSCLYPSGVVFSDFCLRLRVDAESAQYRDPIVDLLLLALPMTFIIMTEGLDLSMGAVLGLTGVVLASALVGGNSLIVAFAAALGVGLAFGIANGLLVVKLGLPPFVATLGTLGIAQGIALVLTSGESVVGIGPALPRLYASRWIGLPFSIVVAALMYAVFHFLLYHTRFGNYVFAIGGNREALVLAGVPAGFFHVVGVCAGRADVGVCGIAAHWKNELRTSHRRDGNGV